MVRPQLTVSPSGIPDPATLIADADFHQSGFVRTLKAEAVLACAVAPATALNVGRWGASIKLS
jgi:hypothetical protein